MNTNFIIFIFIIVAENKQSGSSAVLSIVPGVDTGPSPGPSSGPSSGSSFSGQGSSKASLPTSTIIPNVVSSIDDAAVAGPSGANFRSNGNEGSIQAEYVAIGEDPAPISAEGNSLLSYTELMTESYPVKSKFIYLKAFKLFKKFLKSKNQWQANTVPTDIQILNYFYHCRHELKWAPTTLWSTYARINAVMKRVYGVSLNSYTRVADVLKSYDSGHVVKQAGIFTPQQIEDFVSDPQLSSKYWLVRKVVCLVGYYGGFRNVELKSLKFENCDLDGMGWWFHFARAKQRGRVEQTSICIPRRQPDWIPVTSDSSRMGLDFDPASLIDVYLGEVERDLHCTKDELKVDFFRATHGMKGQKFTQLPLGKNSIGKVGVQVATELCLPSPEIYTGHCWRRSCGTSASDSGVNVTTLMSMMGWSNPKTAMVYVKKSRMTSLSMSLYLANVQRSNVVNPFPRSQVEKREAVKQIQGSKSAGLGVLSSFDSSSCKSSTSREISESVLKLEQEDAELATQDLIRDLETEEMGGDVVEVDRSVFPNSLESVSPPFAGNLGVDGEKREGGVESESCGVVTSSSLSNQLSGIDPRMAGILHNLQNSGNMTIHFHFDGNQK